LAIVAFVVELINFVINRYYLNPPESTEERRLAKEARLLRLQEKALDSPSTFIEYAKKGREATAVEVKMNDLKKQRADRKNSEAGKLATKFAYVLFPFPLAFSYFFWASYVSSTQPVMAVPNSSWIWPVAHMLALPNQPANGSVSSVGWMFLCRRVFARILELVLL